MKRPTFLALIIGLAPGLAAASWAQTGSNTVISDKNGFDKCGAATTAQMQTWWDNSPFWDANIYIGGINRSCAQPNLTISWVSQVTTMGWRLIPTWVGPQAPCTSCTGCSRLSRDVATAQIQGTTEANAAADAAVALGLIGTIIYYDMERYAEDDGTCRPAVRAFLEGWTQQTHARGNNSGVYGSPSNASNDWAILPNPPNAVWIAQWVCLDQNDNACYAAYTPSVWGIPGLNDGLWSSNQRIHQYRGGHNETWGTVTFNIDSNIALGPVAVLPQSPSLSVSLSASPPSGTVPLTSQLSATVSGSATGTINYTFWWNCADAGTSVGNVMAVCGSIPTPTMGSCASNANGIKCDGVFDNPKVVGTTYLSAGSYTAKVITERGTAPPAEGRAPITVTGATGPPPTPSNFRVTGTTTTSASLAWDDVTGESGYRIYKWNGSTFSLYAPLGPNVTTYTDAGLNCNNPYFYEVSAYNASGESGQSAWVQADTLPCGVVFQDLMESGVNGWSGGWAQTTSSSYSPTHSWTDSPGGNYQDNANNSLFSPAINLGGLGSASLTFWHRFDFAAGDGGNVWVRQTSTGNYVWLGAFNGTAPSWRQDGFSLNAFLGQSIQVVFQVVSNATVTADGWYIDDVSVGTPPDLIFADGFESP